MTQPSDPDALPAARPAWQACAETVLIFAAFFLQGAWPVPEVNEPYYLGKAIHFWNPQWAVGDFFLDSADTHWVFNLTFGWLSLVLTPWLLAWTGRLLTWGLLAWAWRRLSVAVVPRPWFAVLSAALFAAGMDRFPMAGEWVIGGVEAKGFAYVLVLLGLEALVRGRWNRVWLLLGGASFFHVLVGGWSVLAAAFAWLRSGRDRPAIRVMLPALVGGMLLSLPGLIPAVQLDRGAPSEVSDLAHEVYVFNRLAHHLDLAQFPPQYVARFALLIIGFTLMAWAVNRRDSLLPAPRSPCHCLPAAASPVFLGENQFQQRASSATPPIRRLGGFVFGALAIALAGGLINGLAEWYPAMAAGLLRFYWYRLADVAVPLGVALFAVALVDRLLAARPPVGKWVLAAAVLLASLHVGQYALRRPRPTPPRSDQWMSYVAWRRACDWIRDSGRIPEHARFLTPRQSQTFKWYTGRSEVVTWKDMPQDSASIAQWWARLNEIHRSHSNVPGLEWRDSLAQLRSQRLKELGAKYGADYLLTEAHPRLRLKRLYANHEYAVYQLRDDAR